MFVRLSLTQLERQPADADIACAGQHLAGKLFRDIYQRMVLLDMDLANGTARDVRLRGDHPDGFVRR